MRGRGSGTVPTMTSPVLLCTDGSPHATAALIAGLAVLDPAAPLAIITVVPDPDPTLVTGTGMAGGVVSPEEYDRMQADATEGAQAILDEARAALGAPEAEVHALRGEPAAAICRYAEEVGAAAIVLGSRGRGGLKRAVLGSVSDHVVRHAPCTVVVTGPEATDD